MPHSDTTDGHQEVHCAGGPGTDVCCTVMCPYEWWDRYNGGEYGGTGVDGTHCVAVDGYRRVRNIRIVYATL